MSDFTPIVKHNVLAAVLAAGRGTRFGGHKLDAQLGHNSLGLWATDAVEQAGFTNRIIVTGPECPQFVKELTGWHNVTNPEPRGGIASSLQIAASCAEQKCSSLLIILADMPLIEPEHLRSLANTVGTTATLYENGYLGVPAKFDRSALHVISSLQGDRGAKFVLKNMAGVTPLIASENSLIDVDEEFSLRIAQNIIDNK